MMPLKKKPHTLQIAYYKHTCCEEMLVCVAEHESLSFLQCYSLFPEGTRWVSSRNES